MKNRFLAVFFIGLSFIGISQSVIVDSPYYYYSKDKKCYLELDTKHVFVSVANENAIAVFDSSNITYKPLRADLPESMLSENQSSRFWTELNIEENLSNSAYLAKLSEIKNAGENIIVSPYFKSQYQEKIGLSNFFYVKLKSLNDTTLLKQEAGKEDLIVVYQNLFMPLWFVVSITEDSRYNAMEAANRFYESGLFEYVEPDLIFEYHVACANDPFFYVQWGLNNTGLYDGIAGIDVKACRAWQISTGSNVIVGVLDSGVDTNHIDLIPNIHPLSFDSEKKTSPQRFCPVGCYYSNHGTMVSGVIGAKRNNATGIAGIAPDCKLMSISNYFEANPLSRMHRADGINWAWRNGADVINNSWSFYNSGANSVAIIIDEAIDSAIMRGRAGKGCVFVACSGNDGFNIHSVYPAESSKVLAVGSINPSGKRSLFSNGGKVLGVVAPGELVFSTDVGGGYDFANGTSLSAPFVSGIAALMLSVNPNLTEKQVRNIIETTTQKIRPDLYTYSTDEKFLPMNFHPHSPWSWDLGYGLVNAHSAVLKAYFLKRLSIRDNVSICDTAYGYLNGPLLDSMDIIWKTSDNIKIISGIGSEIIKYKGLSAGKGWIECWVIRHGDTVFIDRKDIRILYPTYIEYNNYSTTTTTGIITILADATISGSFTVNAGHTVNIQNKNIYCTEDAKIVVMPGGKLIIENSTLKSAEPCNDKMWQGIEVWGNTYQSQTAVNQGTVELRNATIADAVCAIRVCRIKESLPYISYVDGGGIVKADNTHFINNKEAVYFYRYYATFYANSGNYNVSYFKNCQFTIDKPFNQPMVSLCGVRGILFENCQFTNKNVDKPCLNSNWINCFNVSRISPDSLPDGIYVCNSSIRMGASRFGISNGNGCQFSGFNRAVCFLNASTSYIYASTFENNYTGIEAEGVQDLKIENCRFSLPNTNLWYSLATDAKGIYLKNSSLYNIVNNEIKTQMFFDGLGIVSENTGAMNNFVKNNTFENLCTSVHAIGYNSNMTLKNEEATGLVYQCNRFQNNGTDISVAENSTIRYIQSGKNTTMATGNTFSNSVWNIYNKSIAWFNYKFLKSDPLHHLPYQRYSPYFQINLNASASHCCTYFGYAGESYYTTLLLCGEPAIWDLPYCESAYSTMGTVYNQKKTDFADTTTISAIDWESPAVINIVEKLEISTDGITITIDGNAPIDELEKQIVRYYELTNLKQQMDVICYRALDILKSDTNGLNMPEYRKWIGRFNTAEADYLLAETHMAFGEFAEAATILSAMPAKYSTLNLDAHQHFLNYLTVVQDISAITDEEIPTTLKNDLVDLAFKEDFVAAKAYSFGETVFGDWAVDYPRAFEAHPSCVCNSTNSYGIAGNNNRSEKQINNGKTQEQQQYTDNLLSLSENEKSEITIKPNPTTGQLTIESGKLKIEHVEIYDVYGRNIVNCQLSIVNSIDVSHLANGMYFIKIITEDGSQQMKKFVKQ